jgi:hypothetical protein
MSRFSYGTDRGSRLLSPELVQELEREQKWMYPWRLSREVETPVLGPELPAIHVTRAALMEDLTRQAIAQAGPEASALDLACNEGWFSHKLLEWGAKTVVGVDIRAENIRRAELLRDHFGIAADRLRLIKSDVFDIRPEVLGCFDVVLLLGLVYHVENPVGLMRKAHELTRSLCVIESQLTRQEEPIVYGWGESKRYERAEASFAVRVEHDSEGNLLASTPGVMSLIPNRVALLEMARAVGFADVGVAEPVPGQNEQYVVGDRAVLFAWRERDTRH